MTQIYSLYKCELCPITLSALQSPIYVHLPAKNPQITKSQINSTTTNTQHTHPKNFAVALLRSSAQSGGEGIPTTRSPFVPRWFTIAGDTEFKNYPFVVFLNRHLLLLLLQLYRKTASQRHIVGRVIRRNPDIYCVFLSDFMAQPINHTAWLRMPAWFGCSRSILGLITDVIVVPLIALIVRSLLLFGTLPLLLLLIPI